MIEDGKGKQFQLIGDSLERLGHSHHQAENSIQSQSTHHKSEHSEKNLMETEGRVYSDLYRNSSEELFLKSLMESSIGMAAPSMETLGFKNLSQTLRVDSQELFNSWLSNGEVHTTSNGHRTRQASRRISTELAALSSQQNIGATFQHNVGSSSDEVSSNLNEYSLRNAVEKGIQASSMYLAKAWFQSSQPMTRSRSSELRRRYAAMQNFQMPSCMELAHSTSGQVNNKEKEEFSSSSAFCGMSIGAEHLRTFMPSSNSPATPFSDTQLDAVDAVSSVVNMLKGTLERKKLANHFDHNETIKEGGSFGYFNGQNVYGNMNSEVVSHNVLEQSGPFQLISPVHMKESRNLQKIDESLEVDVECVVAPSNPVHTTGSQEPSQSESSAAAPAPSSGFEVCDGPACSGQTASVSESTRKRSVNGNGENTSKAKEFRERMLENGIKEDHKKGNLARVGSVTSVGSDDKADPTKKRRVERSRKMAEAKERNLSPQVPSDMQSLLKRCDNLEKEVRSLKLNLSFMNRKDSEQTKQIEELQKQNEELIEEKERLLEEIERILSESSGKM